MTKLLLCIPPLTQLNTPYPSTAYLCGFLRGRGYDVAQADLGIEMILKLFSKNGFQRLFKTVRQQQGEFSENAQRILHLQRSYEETVGPVISFLQNKDDSLAYRICNENYLPQASRFDNSNDLELAFGSMGIRDQARYLATMYLEDIGDLIIECISPHFGFSRYAESLAMSATEFLPIHLELQEPNTLIDEILLEVFADHLTKEKPDFVGFSVPFPGNLYGAFKCMQYLREKHPAIKILMGGGYPNTELRDITDPLVFHYLDYITLDDGESPVMRLLDHLDGKLPQAALQRTFLLENDQVRYIGGSPEDIPHIEIGAPDYAGLPLDRYLSTLEMLNPMHRLWSDGRWNKLTIAHGCYWKRCSFCDIGLDYIGRYEQAPAKILVDRIEKIVAQTGETGFHFVDEAAPPLALRDLAVELIRRQVPITWWTNIRFEKTFNKDLCRLLAAAGCVAVSGGLEVASDRLLAMMEKGVSVDQVARVTQGFTEAGIMVHAYLMYGFPTQSDQETIDSLEVVRQLFEQGCIQSAFWHRFSMTAHSPVGKNPAKYEVAKIGPEQGAFAYNDLLHDDPKGTNHGRYTQGLNKALFNYMHGVLLDAPLDSWFDFRVRRTSHHRRRIAKAIATKGKADGQLLAYRIYWSGGLPALESYDDGWSNLTFYTNTNSYSLEMETDVAEWLHGVFPCLLIQAETVTTLRQLKEDFEGKIGGRFSDFLESELWLELRSMGLLVLRF